MILSFNRYKSLLINLKSINFLVSTHRGHALWDKAQSNFLWMSDTFHIQWSILNPCSFLASLRNFWSKTLIPKTWFFTIFASFWKLGIHPPPRHTRTPVVGKGDVLSPKRAVFTMYVLMFLPSTYEQPTSSYQIDKVQKYVRFFHLKHVSECL